MFNIINISRKGLYDALTGLPTRNLFRQRVNDTIEKMPGRLFGVFILDMDNLKAINDHLGHKAGDKAIRSFASTLKNSRNATSGWPAVTGATNSSCSSRWTHLPMLPP